MDARNKRNNLDDSTIRYIRFAARRLIGRYGFTSEDQRDLEQDLTLDLLGHLPGYDPGRAKLSTFVKMVVDQRIAALIDAQKAAKRNYTLRIHSLDERIYDDDGEWIPRIETIATDVWFRARGEPGYTIEEHIQLCIDLRRVEARLAPDERQLFAWLWAKPIVDISREMGIPRTTLYDRIEKLRIILERLGMRDYL